MIIAVPTLDKRRYWSVIMGLYDIMSAQYNKSVAEARLAGDRSRNPLRSAHRELFIALVNMACSCMECNKYIFHGPGSETTALFLQRESMTPYRISTNRSQLAERTLKSGATVYRLIMRLIDAGILQNKVYHGPSMNFEVEINPELLPISDELNQAYDPLKAILTTTQNQAIITYLRSICTVYYNNQNCFNNIIIPERKKVKSEISTLPYEQPRTENPNTEGRPHPGSRSGDKNTGKAKINEFTNAFGVKVDMAEVGKRQSEAREAYAEKLEVSRTQDSLRLRKFAMLLVSFMMEHLFKGRNIYPGEVDKARTVAEYYFEEIYRDNGACNAAFEQYKARILLVERYIRRNGYDFSNIYPARYLDPGNTTSGFIMTDRWLRDSEKFKRMKKRSKRLATADDIFRHAFENFTRKGDLTAYNYWKRYIRKRLPERAAEFEESAKHYIGL